MHTYSVALFMLILSAGSAFAQAYSFEQLSWAGGGAGTWDGAGGAARFNAPQGLAADVAGNLYAADTTNHVIRKITPAGEVMTLAGSNVAGSADGRGSFARFNAPVAIAVDGAGNVYVADYADHTIRKITPGGRVTTLAGLAGQAGNSDGTGSAARFRNPTGLTVDSGGNVLVADYWNHLIRKITPDGEVTTLQGGFFFPTGIAIAPGGDLYITEERTHRILKLTPAGDQLTVAGANGGVGNADGTGSAARFNAPSGIAVDGSGNVYIADTDNNLIRLMTPDYAVTKLAGNPEPAFANSGSLDGTRTAARFAHPRGITTDIDGNVYVADTLNHTIRKVTADGVVTTFAGRAAGGATVDGDGAAARVKSPRGVAVDPAGNIYVADAFAHVIRKATPGGSLSTLAGLADTTGSANGDGTAARFNTPGGIAATDDGHLFVADTQNHTIRKITPLGEVSTLAGLAGSAGDVDETGSLARFFFPFGIALDDDGNIYVADRGNNKVKKVTSGGVVTTIASLSGVARITVDGSGDIFVTDGASAVWKVSQAGVVTAFAGSAAIQGSADGPRLDARFYGPHGVGLDAAGTLYLSDTYNNTFRRIASDGSVTTPAGLPGAAGNNEGTGTTARFFFPLDLTADSEGTVTMIDGNDTIIRRGRPALATDPFVTPAEVVTGSQVQLGVTTPATSYSWRVIRRPADSVAQLSDATAETPTFTPDKPDLYTFLLRAESAAGLRIAEVTLGVVAPSSSFWTLPPCRIIDSRESQPLGGSATMTVSVTGRCGVPGGARAIAANLTAVDPTDVGWLAVHQAGMPWTGTSTLNFRPGKTRANNALVALSFDGKLEIRNGSTVPTHFIIDVSGYFE